MQSHLHQFGSGSGLHLFLFQIKWDDLSRQAVVSLKFLSVKYAEIQSWSFFTANNFSFYQSDVVSERLRPLKSLFRCGCSLVIVLLFLFSAGKLFLEQVDGTYHQVSWGGWLIQESGNYTCKSCEAQRHHCEQICFQYFTVKLQVLCGMDDKSTVHLLLVLQFSFLLCFN